MLGGTPEERYREYLLRLGFERADGAELRTMTREEYAEAEERWLALQGGGAERAPFEVYELENRLAL